MKNIKRKEQKQMGNKGFSLVELIVVIAIMAVLVAVLAPQFTRYVDKSRQSNDATTVAGIVNAAQSAVASPEYGITPDTYTITLSKNAEAKVGVTATGNKQGMEKAITDTCGALANLKVTANGWDSNKIDITFTVGADNTVKITYTDDFAKYIGYTNPTT